MDVVVLAQLLKEAEQAHKRYELNYQNGINSNHTASGEMPWPEFYATYMAPQMWRVGRTYPDGVHTKAAEAGWRAHARQVLAETEKCVDPGSTSTLKVEEPMGYGEGFEV